MNNAEAILIGVLAGYILAPVITLGVKKLISLIS